MKDDRPRNPQIPPDALESEIERSSDPEESRQRDDPEVPFDAPEADVLEQSQSWGEEEIEDQPKFPEDAPEADVLEQSRTSGFDDREPRDG
jgi:hypothetical protein